MALRVSEIFFSIQGEGRRAGVVSVFVRLAGCDLRCKWCDTPYALDSEKGTLLSVEEVVSRIEKYDCREVVVTGGEPLLARVQAAFREKYGFSDRLAGLFHFGGARIMRMVPRGPE